MDSNIINIFKYSITHPYATRHETTNYAIVLVVGMNTIMLVVVMNTIVLVVFMNTIALLVLFLLLIMIIISGYYISKILEFDIPMD